MLNLNDKIDFELEGCCKGKVSNYKASDYKGKWFILVFYISDFSVLCPTELKDIAENYQKVLEQNSEVLSVSTDPVISHQTWNNSLTNNPPVLFPMLSDLEGKVSTNFGILNEQTGRSRRATFIIDPESKVRSIEISDDLVSRSFKDALRKLESLIYITTHEGMGCPADWGPGMNGIEIPKE